MEVRVGRAGEPLVTGSLSEVIESERLPLYEQAAQNTGFRLSVSARKGQRHTFYDNGVGMRRTITIPEGKLGITINKPVEEKDHSAFWNEYKKLKAEQPPKSSPL